MRWTLTLLFAVTALATATIGQPAEPQTPPTPEPGAANPAEGQISENATPEIVAPEASDGTTQLAAGATTEPASEPTDESTTEPSTEPSTEASTEPTTMPGRTRRVRHATTRTHRGGVKWGSEPTTQLAAAMATTRMSKTYSILETRSMFVKGHAADTSRSNGGGSATASTNPTTSRPESTLLFTGVTVTSDQTEALIEDTVSGHVTTLKPGDPVASGKVTKITLDSLNYQSEGKTVLVTIGQNFEGVAIAPPDTTSPSGNLGVSDEPPGDIIERLRRKRQQELGGGK